MRSRLRRLAVMAALMLSACDAPADQGVHGAAVVAPPPKVQPLPAPVAATVKRVKEIAKSGSYRDLARLAGETPDFRSNNAGFSHAEYWSLKMRTGDFPMAHAEKVLGYRHAVADSPQGKIYIWPWVAMLTPEEIAPQAVHDIEELLGPGQADALREGAYWPGYVLGIREDGQWLYFISGSG